MSVNNEKVITSFKNKIITKGSNVFVILMMLLLNIFLVQTVRKVYDYYCLQSKLAAIPDVLEMQNYPLVTYDLDTTAKEIYENKQIEGISTNQVKYYLLQRAIKCIDRISLIRRDANDIRKLHAMDFLPQHVWHNFISSQQSIEKESTSIVKENQTYKFNWGSSHRNNIFSKASEVYRMASAKQRTKRTKNAQNPKRK
eukprot:330843_1